MKVTYTGDSAGCGFLFFLVWLSMVITTIVGIISAFFTHIVIGLLFLIPPLGFIQGVGLVFRMNLAQAVMNFLRANGVAF